MRSINKLYAFALQCDYNPSLSDGVDEQGHIGGFRCLGALKTRCLTSTYINLSTY